MTAVVSFRLGWFRSSTLARKWVTSTQATLKAPPWQASSGSNLI